MLKLLNAVSFMLVIAGGLAAQEVWNFDSDTVGQVPEGFTVASGAWEVVEESTAPSQPNALKQTGDDTYNLIWVDGTSYKDFELIVKVQAISGNTDQGGGFVWRGVDDENYYVSRYNPRESFMSLDIRKMVDGKRTTLAQTNEAVCDFEWHTLRLVMEGDVMELYFDDDLLCEADDGTFPDAGMIGIWSKADAVTHYDDLTAKELGTGILIKKYSAQMSCIEINPDPFMHTTHIKYSLQNSDYVKLAIYDMMGHMIALLADKYHVAGSYVLYWGTDNSEDRSLANGIYFIRLQTGKNIQTDKFMLVK